MFQLNKTIFKGLLSLSILCTCFLPTQANAETEVRLSYKTLSTPVFSSSFGLATGLTFWGEDLNPIFHKTGFSLRYGQHWGEEPEQRNNLSTIHRIGFVSEQRYKPFVSPVGLIYPYSGLGLGIDLPQEKDDSSSSSPFNVPFLKPGFMFGFLLDGGVVYQISEKLSLQLGAEMMATPCELPNPDLPFNPGASSSTTSVTCGSPFAGRAIYRAPEDTSSDSGTDNASTNEASVDKPWFVTTLSFVARLNYMF